MDNWLLLNNEMEFKEKIRALKRKNRGHFFTNYISLNSCIDKELDYTEAFYIQDENNIYMLKRNDDFYRLYYGIGEPEKINLSIFPRSIQNEIIVCDIVELEGKERQKGIVDGLVSGGFRQYKKYHMWECKDIEFKHYAFNKYELVDDKDSNHFLYLYEIFDVYSDMLPIKRMFELYIQQMRTLSLFKAGVYMGSEIYNIEGNTAMGEFAYVLKRGKGIGGVLIAKVVENAFNVDKVKKFFAWIQDENRESANIHMDLGFLPTNQYKITLIRGNV